MPGRSIYIIETVQQAGSSTMTVYSYAINFLLHLMIQVIVSLRTKCYQKYSYVKIKADHFQP